MTWKPAEDTDREVRQWMKAKGWEVTGAEYDFEQRIYTWSARSIRSGHSPAVRISQRVLQDPAFAILEHLNKLNVADAIRRRPEAVYVVVQNGLRVTIEETTA